MNVLDLFSGVGGFSLGLEMASPEFKTIAFCEIDPFCQKVLKKHWPDVPCYEDVKDVTKARLESDGIGRIDVITGGFPCQDISVAGKQAGIEGERSGLWSELCRIIGDIRPRYAIVENVTALISGDRGRWFGRVLGDLAEIGFDAEWHCIPASELGANHHRDRVWIVAYPKSNGNTQLRQPFSGKNTTSQEGTGRINELYGLVRKWKEGVSNANSQGLQRGEKQRGVDEIREKRNKQSSGCFCYFDNISKIKPTLCGGDDGVSHYMDRLRSLGNAVVPQIPEIIGRAIIAAQEYE